MTPRPSNVHLCCPMGECAQATKPTNCDSSGFTLVELLVVVLILGILVALILPQIGQFTARALSAKCSQNVRNLSSAVLSFAADNNGRLPIGYYPPYSSNVWQQDIHPFLTDTNYVAGLGIRSKAGGYYQCPTVTKKDIAGANSSLTSYGINQNVLLTATDVGRGLTTGKLVGSIALPGRTVLLGDMQLVNGDFITPPGMSSPGATAFRHGDSKPAHPDVVVEESGLKCYGRGRANVSFCDGHVESLTADQSISDEIKWIVK